MGGMSLTLQNVSDLLLGIGVVAWICYRQTTWQVVDPARLWRWPVIAGAVGLATFARPGGTVVLTAVDLVVLALELVLAAGAGAAMGAIARFRPLAPGAITAYESGDRGGRSRAGTVRYETRTGWAGVALWLALIAVRIGMDVAATRLGAEAVTGTAMILLVLAANRAARTAVLVLRLERLGVAAQRVSV